MAITRWQVTNVGYWRGQAHRWQNTFHYSGDTEATVLAAGVEALATSLSKIGYATYHGGIAEIKVYASTGGVPLFTNVFFPWANVADWTGFTGSAWSSGGAKAPISTGESAMVFEVPAGVSKNGKPVTLKTYCHAIPVGATESGAVDIIAADVTSLQTEYNKLQVLTTMGAGLTICAPDGRPVGSLCTLKPYYVAHQRVKGRKRTSKALQAELAKRGYTGKTTQAVPLPVEED